MSKYNLTAGAKLLRLELVVTNGNFKPQGRTFYSPSTSLANDVIKFSEAGVYKHSMRLNEFGTIGGQPAPSTIEDAFDDVNDLIDSIGTVI